MRKLTNYSSLWQSLLAVSIFIILYLISLNIREALSYSSIASYFNKQHAHISWAPPKGPVDHYLLEVTDTRFLSE